jgi:hypothetical protein
MGLPEDASVRLVERTVRLRAVHPAVHRHTGPEARTTRTPTERASTRPQDRTRSRCLNRCPRSEPMRPRRISSSVRSFARMRPGSVRGAWARFCSQRCS